MNKTALVTRLGRIAGRAAPPPLEEIELRRMVQHALGTKPIERSRSRARFVIAAIAAAAAAITAWWAMPRSHEAPAQVIEMILPTGDHLVGVAGSKFEVEDVTAAHRRIALHGGEVMFDVAHVVDGQRFEVVTDQLIATAKGTVFSVEADAQRSRVRVYEGVVEVTQAGDVHALIAGAVWDSAMARTEIAMVRSNALSESIDGALRERAKVIAVKPPAVMIAKPTPKPTPVKIDPTATLSAWSTDSVKPEAMSRDQLLVTARSQLAAGNWSDALASAELAKPWTGTWWQLVADAQRGLRQFSDAATAYDRAAEGLTGADREEAGYSAAYLRHHDLHDAKAALASLDASHADADGAPLEERALALRAQLLVALGRDPKPTAKRYLARFPHADLRAYMLALVGS